MNAGVWISPCGVVMVPVRPALADPSGPVSRLPTTKPASRGEAGAGVVRGRQVGHGGGRTEAGEHEDPRQRERGEDTGVVQRETGDVIGV